MPGNPGSLHSRAFPKDVRAGFQLMWTEPAGRNCLAPSPTSELLGRVHSCTQLESLHVILPGKTDGIPQPHVASRQRMVGLPLWNSSSHKELDTLASTSRRRLLYCLSPSHQGKGYQPLAHQLFATPQQIWILREGSSSRTEPTHPRSEKDGKSFSLGQMGFVKRACRSPVPWIQ